MIDQNDLEAYRKAGQIIKQLRFFARSLVRENAPLMEICQKIEMESARLGARPAFPCNVGVNEVAAHYTSPIGDTSKVPAGSVVKVDFGVHVDGFIADTAVTVSLSAELETLTLAAEDALKHAIEPVKPGKRIEEIGAVIQRTIERYGCRPISNLTGHKIERYTIHAGKSIPNVSGVDSGVFAEGEVYAIEPFVTLKKAAGRVRDSQNSHIFRFMREKGAKSAAAKNLVTYVRERFRGLPFAQRWLAESFEVSTLHSSFQELLKSRCLRSYPVLVEESGQAVAQAEHTILVTRDGCEVLTG